MRCIRITVAFAACLSATVFADEQLIVAVASNFRSAAIEIGAEFTKATDIPVRMSAGSTGKLFAQISHGAPYDVFLAADELRPALLEENGLGVPGSRVSYALGSLVLWSTDRSMKDQDCRAALGKSTYSHLAIANPATAPYGLAAKEFLISEELWDEVSSRIVFGENISQTLQFVETGNASLGLVARTQISGELKLRSTCYWLVPASGHAKISQQALVLSASRNLRAAELFLNFLRGPIAADILRRRGYGVPE